MTSSRRERRPTEGSSVGAGDSDGTGSTGPGASDGAGSTGTGASVAGRFSSRG